MPGTALSIAGLSKTFPGQKALVDFAIDVRPGEIHALVGENGSGKSTFIKCLSGYHAPDAGARIEVGDEEIAVPYAPSAARRHGLVFIHQDLGLVRTMSVMDNLALSRGYRTGFAGRIRWRAERRRALEMLAEFGHPELDPDMLVGDLPLAMQTVVAVARALHDGGEAKVIVLDEPTASMPHKESLILFETIRKVAATGVGVIYVSHRLEEVFDLCDKVTALRDGRLVGTRDVADLDYRGLVELIVGKSVDQLVPPADDSVRDEVVLRFDRVSGGVVSEASGVVRAGEIVGVTGLLGSGSTDLGKLLFGAIPRSGGDVAVAGRVIAPERPGDAMRAGVSYVPSDRAGAAILPRQSMVDNVLLPDAKRFFSGWRRSGQEHDYVEQLLGGFDVKPLAPEREIYTLSGGNQQKVVLAKWIALNPRVLILDEPVQGIDIGAKTEVYQIIQRAAADGMAVVVISTEVEDLTRLCHRVLVMREGLITDELRGAEMTRAAITQLTYADEGATL
jgi:ribose transport system ATP-binding protein